MKTTELILSGARIDWIAYDAGYVVTPRTGEHKGQVATREMADQWGIQTTGANTEEGILLFKRLVDAKRFAQRLELELMEAA